MKIEKIDVLIDLARRGSRKADHWMDGWIETRMKASKRTASKKEFPLAPKVARRNPFNLAKKRWKFI